MYPKMLSIKETQMNCEFHHVHLRSEDLEAAVAYYEKMFDGKVSERVEVRGLEIVRMDIGGERIFISPRFGGLDIEPTSGRPRWGVYQLAFLVDDIDAAVAELEEKGAELEDLKPAGLPMAFYKGPDNVQIELIER
jgi:catechol 2,3-dioxygenase-like lactoylglutathione lyase family enzyme